MSCYRNIFEAIVKQAGSAGEPIFTPHGLDDKPVDCMPGSPRKIEVLAMRLMKGVELWHPKDRHCLDRSTHRAMVSDLTGPVYDEADDLIWVELGGRIVMLTDVQVIISKRRAGGKGWRQMRLRRDSVYAFRYASGLSFKPQPEHRLLGIQIPNWLAVSRNLEEM